MTTKQTILKATKPFYVFMIIVIVHLWEHIIQLTQVYLLGMPRKESLGFIGLIFPYLFRNEVLHFSFALIMLFGLVYFRKQVNNRLWDTATVLQFFHFVEHCLLITQYNTKHYLFGCTVPCSIGQLFIPRIELHALYTIVITGVMILALIRNIKNDNLLQFFDVLLNNK